MSATLPSTDVDTNKALTTFDFLTGGFLLPKGGRGGNPKGTELIIGSLMTFKSACFDIFPRIYMGVSAMIANMLPIGSIIRKPLGGLFLPFLLFMFVFHSHINSGVLPNIATGKDAIAMLYYSFLAATVISYFVVMCNETTDLSVKEEKDALDLQLQKHPILVKSPVRCNRCQIPNVLRSYHCMFCNSHTAKFHEHSPIFNKCIGAGNMIPYTVFYLLLSLLILIGAASTQLPREEGKELSKPMQIIYKLMFICYVVFCLGRFQTFLINAAHIYFNITGYEYQHWPQLSYFWKNPRKEFFNPFDKGPSKNFKEEAHSLLNHSDKPKAKADDSVEEVKLKEVNEDLEDSESKTLMEERNKIVNWRSERILAVTDVYSSPMRSIFMEFIKKQNQMKKQAEGSAEGSAQ